MKCNEVLSLMSSYIDEEVGLEEKKKIEAHLEKCEECASSLSELREILGLLEELQEVPVPPELAERIRVSVRQEGRKEAQNGRPDEGRERIFPKRALRYLLVFSGVLAAFVAIIIPLRAFWTLQTGTERAPKSQKSLSVEEKAPATAQKSIEKAGKNERFDSLPEGKLIKQTSINYGREGVKGLVDFFEDREKEETYPDYSFSRQLRDATIAAMLDEAKQLQLNIDHFADSIELLVADNENILPVYAEKTYFQSKEAWIIVVKDFLPDKRGYEMKAYVVGIPECQILYSTD